MTAIALVACRAAAADPGAADPGAADPRPVAHAAAPAGWARLPAIAEAASRAAGGARADAWGEPAMGCYAVWLELRGASADAPALADQVLGGITGLSVTEVARPAAADGVLAFGFARPPYRGRLRAQLGGGRIAATACFGNQREPRACDTACAHVLEDVR